MGRLPKALRISLLAAGVLAGIVALALAVLLFVDVDRYKPHVEAMASSALGMEVSIEGRLRLGFVPRFQVNLEKVRVRNRGSEVALAEEADLAVDFLSLLRRAPRYDSISLKRARISLERGRDGAYNVGGPPGQGQKFPGLELPQVSFSETVISYADKETAGGFESVGCEGELARIQHPGDAPFLARLSLSGKVACNEVRGKKFLFTDLRFSVEAREGVFEFKPLTMRAFGGEGSGVLRMDRSGAVPILHLDYALKRFRVEEYFKGLPAGKSASGRMDFSMKLAARGRSPRDWRRSANGEMSLSGTNLVLAGVDLDKALARYESSQSFNLFDLTAFAFAGPLGLAVTKGAELANLAQQEGGSTPVPIVVSKWKVDKGVAHARDVALTTRENRIALHGGLDFVNEEFDAVVVALIDANGCAKVRQNIRGPFSKPIVEKPNVLASVTGPVRRLLDKARDMISGTREKCEVFYSGSVAAPS